jgi:hypothetical protein
MHSEMSPDCGMASLGDLIKSKSIHFSRAEIQWALFRRKIASWWASISNVYSFSKPERCKKLKCHQIAASYFLSGLTKIPFSKLPIQENRLVAGWLA